jgi:hypothetical protein
MQYCAVTDPRMAGLGTGLHSWQIQAPRPIGYEWHANSGSFGGLPQDEGWGHTGADHSVLTCGGWRPPMACASDGPATTPSCASFTRPITHKVGVSVGVVCAACCPAALYRNRNPHCMLTSHRQRSLTLRNSTTWDQAVTTLRPCCNSGPHQSQPQPQRKSKPSNP